MSDETEGESSRETRDERKQRVIETKIQRLRELRGLEPEEITGYVYRETYDSGRQSLPPVEDVLFDHDLGLKYGPGKYIVTYHYTLGNGQKKFATERYNIGPEYRALHIAHCEQTGQECYITQKAVLGGQGAPAGGLMDLLSKDKIEGVVAMLSALKIILGGQNGPNQEVETLKFVLENNSKILAGVLGGKGGHSGGGISDNITTMLLENALKRPREESPISAMRSQLDLFKEIKIMTDPTAAREAESQAEEMSKGPMDKIIERALDMLPAILEKFGGNETAAAANLKEKNFMVRHYLKDPNMQKQMYLGIRRDHGEESAARWAAGFGIDPRNFFPAKAAPAPVGVQGATKSGIIQF